MKGWVFVFALLLVPLAACERRPPSFAEPRLVLAPASFAELPGWQDDDPRPALRAFSRSCQVWMARPPDAPLAQDRRFGVIADWLPACAAAAGATSAPGAARRFLEEHFVVFGLRNHEDPRAFFTGYYEPLLAGARRPDDRFRYPLYRLPEDLVTVELGLFDPELDGRRLVGRLDGQRLVPYPERAEIDHGALAGRGLELLWVDDPIGLFFLQIQGSGRIRLADGRTIRVGYAGQNGHPYRAIGRDLVEMGALAPEQLSLFSIRAWLRDHPGEARRVMARNRSYVFFRELGQARDDEGPPGSMGVALEPGRSLAVDRRYLPLGVPLWLATTLPYPDGERPFARLVVAQDTGGAIRGPLRADLFLGAGPKAEWIAGHLKHPGRLWLLLPRGLAPVLAARSRTPLG